MLLTEFFNNPEGDSYAKFTSTSPTSEAKRSQISKNQLAGSKTSNSKKFPNSVSVKEDAWTGANNAWSDGQGQWNDGTDQWHSSDSGMGGSTGGAAKVELAASAELDEDSNPTDTVTMDIPLVIRMLEYAREDAKSDMELHKVTERMIALGANGQTLTMDDYNKICGTKE